MIVQLGNSSVQEAYRLPNDDTLYHRPLAGDRITTVPYPEGISLVEAFQAVAAPDGIWAHHSTGPAPTWVYSDSPGLAALLAEHFGGIPVLDEAQPEPSLADLPDPGPLPTEPNPDHIVEAPEPVVVSAPSPEG